MTNEKYTNGWDEVKRLINFRLDQQETSFKELKDDFDEFRTTVITEIAIIKAQSSLRGGIWGAVTGLLGAIGIILIFLATH